MLVAELFLCQLLTGLSRFYSCEGILAAGLWQMLLSSLPTHLHYFQCFEFIFPIILFVKSGLRLFSDSIIASFSQ